VANSKNKTKSAFSADDVPCKIDGYHGSAKFERTRPPLEQHEMESVNVEISFEEALKLSQALQSCLMQLNRYHRGTVAGREMGLLLSLKSSNSCIAVIERRIRTKE